MSDFENSQQGQAPKRANAWWNPGNWANWDIWNNINKKQRSIGLDPTVPSWSRTVGNLVTNGALDITGENPQGLGNTARNTAKIAGRVAESIGMSIPAIRGLGYIRKTPVSKAGFSAAKPFMAGSIVPVISGLQYSFSPEARRNVEERGFLGGAGQNVLGLLRQTNMLTKEDMGQREAEYQRAKQFRDITGTLNAGNSWSAVNAQSGLITSMIDRIDPLTGKQQTTQMEGGVMVRKPNLLRPGQFENVVIDAETWRKMPSQERTGWEVVGHQIYRVDPLTGKLGSTIISDADLKGMGLPKYTDEVAKPTDPLAGLKGILSGMADAQRRSAGLDLKNTLENNTLRRKQAQEDALAREAQIRQQSAGDIMQGISQATDTGLAGPGAANWAAQAYGTEQQSAGLAENQRTLRQLLAQLALSDKQARRGYSATVGKGSSKDASLRSKLGL